MIPPPNDLFASRPRELAALVLRFAGNEGMHPTCVPGMQCIKLSHPHRQLPAVYRPSLCVIVQGAKQVLLGEEVYRYAPPQFLAVSVDLPLVGQVIDATADAPYLCLAIDLDARVITDLVSQWEGPWPRTPTSRGILVGDLDCATQEATLRYARLMETPQDISVLAPLVLREIHYRLLAGADGPAIAQIAIAGSQTHRIAQVIRKIKSQLATTLSIEELAAIAKLSASAFHQQFKAVTAMSPLQYQKRLRLTEARQLLLGEDIDATTAAYRVGYQSVSQFSREYARMFGSPPIRDVQSVRADASMS